MIKSAETVRDQCLNINRKAVTSHFILEDATNCDSFLFHTYRDVEHCEPVMCWKHEMRIYSDRSIKAEYKLYYFPLISSWKEREGGERGRIPIRTTNEDWNNGSTWWKGYSGFWVVRDGQAVPFNRRGTLSGWTEVLWESLIRKLWRLWIKQRCTCAVHSEHESKALSGFWRLHIALNLPQTDLW